MLASESDKITQLIQSFTLPCHPRVIASIEEEYAQEDPDIGNISFIISADVKTSAAMLQIANAPLFLDRVGAKESFETIDAAVNFLGLGRVKKIIDTLTMQDQVQHVIIENLDEFWKSAVEVAIVSAHLAQSLFCANPDEAYMLGLFRDAGVPVLSHSIAGYKEMLESFDRGEFGDKTLPEIEQEKFHVDHQIIGYAIAVSWRLPDVISRAILTQHEFEKRPEDTSSLQAKKLVLVSLVQIAEMIAERYNQPNEQHIGKGGWPELHPFLLENLDTEEQELLDLMDDTLDKMSGLIDSYKVG